MSLVFRRTRASCLTYARTLLLCVIRYLLCVSRRGQLYTILLNEFYIGAFSRISPYSFAYPRYRNLSCASSIEHEMLEKNSPENAGDMHLCISRSFLDEKFLCTIEKRVTEERTEIFFARKFRVLYRIP